ncbi:MAG: Arc family DNA-binding protein [Oscillospiraceae bacterium]|jgi:hypothetical protein|nr:Arc family DNA-binding protein [Oscillospiraceae bacterium]
MPKAIPGRIATQARLDEITYKKMKIIAQLENRNANSQLEYFMKKGVEAYEAEHGAIQLSDED